MIRGIHHIALHTQDIERMIAFYRDVIGFEVITRLQWADSPEIDAVIGVPGSAARSAMLRAANCYLELFEYARPPSRDAGPARPSDHGYTHLCLDVTDIHADYDRLKKAGMAFAAAPGDFGDIKAVYGKDPDGNLIEIQELAPDQPFALRRLEMLGGRFAGHAHVQDDEAEPAR